MKKGFTLIETLIVLAIIGILTAIVIVSLMTFSRNEALNKDTETVVEVLRLAQNMTLSSKDQLQYGVHITSTSTTIFSGTTYNASASTNSIYKLKTSDLILGVSLNGGGNDVVFSKLSGETSQYGTLTFSSASANLSRTVTIYKTGLVEGPKL